MQDRHEPNDEFVEKLQWQIGHEVRLQNRAANAPRWATWSPAKALTVVVALMLVSMAAGGAAVAAAYEAQSNERRGPLVTNFEQRAELARIRVSTVAEQVKTAEQRASIGVASGTEVLESRIKLTEAQVQHTTALMQLDEVRLTGNEPRAELSAPLVSGRDFVILHLRNESAVPEKNLALEMARLKDTQRRVDVGVSDAMALEAAQVRVLEVQAALDTVRTKIEIRQKFLSGAVDTVETELRALEAEADRSKKVLAAKVEMARKDAKLVAARVEVGVAQQVEQAEATLRRLDLEALLAKADLDLALIRRRIDQHRAGR